MWIVFDIGNSAIKAGLFRDGVLERTFVVTHDAGALAARLHAELGDGVERAGLASVVPPTSERVAHLLRAKQLPLTTVGVEMRLPFAMAYETPLTLGTDRLAAAAAAWIRHGRERERTVVALDAGTALTYEVVDRSGTYLGGTITPGPALLQRALHTETAQLPHIALELPQEPIGRSTIQAMQAGIMYGFLDGVRGMLARIKESVEDTPIVVATGGWSHFLGEHLDHLDEVDPHLVLHGIRHLMEMNP